jgi:transposase
MTNRMVAAESDAASHRWWGRFNDVWVWPHVGLRPITSYKQEDGCTYRFQNTMNFSFSKTKMFRSYFVIVMVQYIKLSEPWKQFSSFQLRFRHLRQAQDLGACVRVCVCVCERRRTNLCSSSLSCLWSRCNFSRTCNVIGLNFTTLVFNGKQTENCRIKHSLRDVLNLPVMQPCLLI